jgi:hypothetical protein
MRRVRSLALVLVAITSGCSWILDFEGAPALGDGGGDANGDGGGDPTEPNDDFATATPITPGSYGPYLIEPSTDKDTFVLVLGDEDGGVGTHDLTLDLLFVQAQGDLDLKLFDGAMVVLAESAGFLDNERIERTAALGNSLPSGTYYVQVVSFNGLRGNEYRLNVTAAP